MKRLYEISFTVMYWIIEVLTDHLNSILSGRAASGLAVYFSALTTVILAPTTVGFIKKNVICPTENILNDFKRLY